METPRDRTDQQPPKQTTLVYICGGQQFFAIVFHFYTICCLWNTVSHCHARCYCQI